jgi:hypothetical protein
MHGKSRIKNPCTITKWKSVSGKLRSEISCRHTRNSWTLIRLYFSYDRTSDDSVWSDAMWKLELKI